ncbi:MAG: dockerin type I domain-containing protein [Chthoniobacterales bacterium]
MSHIIRKVTYGGAVTTIAGLAGVAGSADGTGSAARFNSPYDVTVDGADNLYVVDTNNQTIRKISPSGVVSTLAGAAGVQGSADGIGNAARFNNPNSLAADRDGNIYVADTFNHTIRKITPSGGVSTLAGLAGSVGSNDGTGSTARFQLPFGVTVDTSGNVYVSDTYNYKIRKITALGVVTTLAGSGGPGSNDGSGGLAQFNAPRGIAVDGAANLYVADEGSSTIRKVTPSGAVTTLAGLAGTNGSADGSGIAVGFNQAAGIAVNSAGAIYIADTRNSTIRRGAAPPKEGALDQAFDAGNFTNGLVSAAVQQPDGKVIIGGSFHKVHGVVRHNLARLNVDGSVDLSFDAGSGPDYGIPTGGMALQGDGKLLIVGAFASVNGVSRTASIARLNSDGSLDNAFDPGRTLSVDGISDSKGNPANSGYANSLILQPDGKVVVAGYFAYVFSAPFTSVPRSGVVRFNSDGSFDASFDPGAGISHKDGAQYGSFLARESSGKIVLQGHFSSYDNHPAPGLVRTQANGSFDETFAPGAATDDFSVFGLFMQANDRLAVYGSFTSFDGAPHSGLVRLTSSGAVDSTFSPPVFKNYVSAGTINSVTQDNSGKLIVSGFFHSVGGVTVNNIARLETNGARDLDFNPTGAGPSGYQVNAVLVRQTDGKIFAGGYFATFGGAIRHNLAWMGNNGVVESEFEGLAGVADYQPQVYALAVQPDSKVLVGGFFNSFRGLPHYNLVRLNPDGTIDPSFNSTFQTEGSIRAMALQPDGKILIAGNVRAVNGVARGSVARLNSDGTLDLSFNSGLGADGLVNALAVDATGNVYIGGGFHKFDSTDRMFLAKLDSSGNLDPSFDPGTGLTATVYAIVVDEIGGKIVAGGSFSTYAGSNVGRVVRLDATTAARDLSFNSGGSGFNSTVRALRLGPNGKYSVGGSFSNFNGVARARVARLQGDGTLDATFTNPQISAPILALALQGDKVIVGGSPFNGMSHPIRINADGGIDSTFDVGAGISIAPTNALSANTIVTALAVQNDGGVLVGGVFNQVNGVPRVALARLAEAPRTFTAVSRKAHGGAGFFDLDLPLTGALGVENRMAGTGGAHQIVVSFGGPVTLTGAFVENGIGQVSSYSGSGTDTVTLNLSGMANAQSVSLSLATVSNGTNSSNLSVPVAFLLGDTTGNGSVTASDIAQTKGQSGQTLSLGNFRTDVNTSGSINASDVGQVKSASGTQVP